MSGIDDVVAGGWWPLRHHAAVDAALRYVRMACMVRADQGDANVGTLKAGRDQYGRLREVDGSAGDVQGGLLWEAASPVVPFNRGQLVQTPGDPPARDFPSLGFAFPAIAQDPNAGKTATTSGVPPIGSNPFVPATQGAAGGGGSGLPTTQSRPTPTPTTAAGLGAPPPLPETVQVLPIQDEKHTADTRYAKLQAASPPGTAKNTQGVVLAATHERRMEPLFLPSGAPLIAVNRAGDPATSSLVFDEKADGTVDPSVYAPLHSAWRVIRLAASCAPALTTSASLRGQLAWQLGGGGRDGLAGYGLAYDSSGGASSSNSGSNAPDPMQQEIAKIQKQLAQIEQQIAAAVAGGSAGASAVGSLVNQRNQLQLQLDQLSAAGASNSQGSTQNKPKGGGGGVVGAFSWRMGGPFDAGGLGCQHQLGRTFDGEAVYSGHLAAGSYFRNSIHDGPLLFENDAVTQVENGPHRMRVHLVWNPSLPHDHPCGSKQGHWWWYAEAMDYLTDGGGGDDGNPPPPPPDDNVPGRIPGTDPNILINDEKYSRENQLSDRFSGLTDRGYGIRTEPFGGHGGGALGGGGSGGGNGDGDGGGPWGPRPHGWPPGPPGTGGDGPWGPRPRGWPGDGQVTDPGVPPGGLRGTSGLGRTWPGYVCQSNAPKDTRWRASTLTGLTAGMVFRPVNLTVGQRELRTLRHGATGISQAALQAANLAPATVRVEAFASRQANQWVYGINRNVSSFPGGTARAGGVWFAPADRDLKNELSGTPYVREPIMTPYVLFHPSMRVGTGSFNQDGTNSVATYNPYVAMPAATPSGYGPISNGLGNYSWAAPSPAPSLYSKATTTATAAITTTETVVAQSELIPANTLQAGSNLRVSLYGRTIATGGSTQVLRFRYGPTGTTADPQILGTSYTSANTGGDNPSFALISDFVVTSAGATGEATGGAAVVNQKAYGFTVGATQQQMLDVTLNALDTTADGYLTVTYESGAAGTSTTFRAPCTVELVKL
jgi:hypothetical protein